MNCRLIDLPCHVWTWIEPFWGWAQIGFWVVAGMVLLWGLTKIKELFGWPGLTAAVAALAALWGYWRGRKGKSLNPLNNQTDIDGPDAAPSTPRPRQRKPLFPNLRKRLNGE